MNPDQISPPIEPVQVPEPNLFKKLYAKVPQKIKEGLNKFYANKKVFWPVTIAFVLIFMVIVVGLLFGSKTGIQIAKKSPTPTPIVAATPQPEAQDLLSILERKLNDLKFQIANLDVNQKRLQPPVINFKVSF
jgi:hypothetical protein